MRIPSHFSAMTSVALLLAGGSALAARVISVDQIGQVFTTTSLELAKGDRVVFHNHDDVTHNISVFGADDDVADLGLQKPGVALTYKFDKDGTFMVRCSIHPTMKMTVKVK